jgi:hypothetical protein
MTEFNVDSCCEILCYFGGFDGGLSLLEYDALPIGKLLQTFRNDFYLYKGLSSL